MGRFGRQFRYVNASLAESLAGEFGIPMGGSVTRSGRLGLAQPVSAELGYSRTEDGASAVSPKTISRIAGKLRKSGQLRPDRPLRVSEFRNDMHDGWYVEERLMATPVWLPAIASAPAGESLTREKALTVWVCGPTNPVLIQKDPWDVVDSVLFLVQELNSLDGLPRGISGISALRLVTDVIGTRLTPHDLYELASGEDEYSNRVEADPIAKLKAAGGQVGLPRPISTIYKVSYMNDEQGIHLSEAFFRINDILAYPLYIAS